MSLVEKCWMVTSKISVIALLMITGIYFGKFVCPYIKKKKGAVAVSIVYIARNAAITPIRYAEKLSICGGIIYKTSIIVI